jgi:hypothetical protein
MPWRYVPTRGRSSGTHFVPLIGYRDESSCIGRTLAVARALEAAPGWCSIRLQHPGCAADYPRDRYCKSGGMAGSGPAWFERSITVECKPCETHAGVDASWTRRFEDRMRVGRPMTANWLRTIIDPGARAGP